MFPNDITVSQNKTELIFIRYRNKNIQDWTSLQSRSAKKKKKQENKINNENKNKSRETDSEITQIIELVEQDTETVIKIVSDMSKKWEEILNMLRRDIKAINST